MSTIISRISYLRELRRELLNYKGNALREFYYLEPEDLEQRSAANKWSIIDVFEHLNLVNYFYIKSFEQGLENAPDATDDRFSHSWLGKKSIQSMRPDQKGNIRKIPTFRKINPLYHQKKGRVLVAQVVFQDFIESMEQLIALAEKMEDKAIQSVNVKTLLPFIKLPLGDALGFITAHTQRHIVQAQKLAADIRAKQ